MTDYADARTLKMLKPDEPELTIESQRMINQAFMRELHKRGARVRRVEVRADEYLTWLDQFGLRNSPENRAQFISWLTAPDPKPIPQ